MKVLKVATLLLIQALAQPISSAKAAGTFIKSTTGMTAADYSDYSPDLQTTPSSVAFNVKETRRL